MRAGQSIDFLIDDSHARKRGKQLQGVGKYRDTSTMAYV